jgi:eukaryotic-like serine/threonine-protein kinase
MNASLPPLDSRYRIERKLGEGGMGTVYLATDTKVGRLVAIKTIGGSTRPDLPQLQRFQIETETTARLQHPHIVQVLDVGFLEVPYIVLEPLEGEPLGAVLRSERQLSVHRACMIATQVLSALGAAHHAQIVHRDIKPGNIFLVSTPPPGVFVKVLDFGVARLLSKERITLAGQTVGSMPYMSPEQHLSEDVDARADLFALGVVLYEMLAGRRPFSGNTPEHAVALMLQGQQPPSIPNCPAELDGHIRRCLAVKPEDRFASALEVARALQPFLPRMTNQVFAHLPPSLPAAPTTPSASVPPSLRPLVPMHTAPFLNPPGTSQAPPSLAVPSAIAIKRKPMWPTLAFIALAIAMLGISFIVFRDRWTSPTDSGGVATKGDSAFTAELARTPVVLSTEVNVASSSAKAPSQRGQSRPASTQSLLDGGPLPRDASAPVTRSGKVPGAPCPDMEEFNKLNLACNPASRTLICDQRHGETVFCPGQEGCHSLYFEPSNCGACGSVCPGYCRERECKACSDSTHAMCNGACVSITTAPHCGACGVKCDSKTHCAPKLGSTGFACAAN